MGSCIFFGDLVRSILRGEVFRRGGFIKRSRNQEACRKKFIKKRRREMFTPELIRDILTLGIVALAVTQAVKKWVKLEGVSALITSLLVSALLALWKTLSAEYYDWLKFIVLFIGVFLESNGTYHFGSYGFGKMVAQKTVK
jgi:hypothetical protein